jgi:hypothetical protein
MLRLRDARTGELTDVLPAGRRQLRILVFAPGQVRGYLTADLLRRAAERSRLLPLVTELVPPQAAATEAAMEVAELRAACDALNVHPPRDTLIGAEPGLSGLPPFDVGIAMGEPGDVAAAARRWISVAVDETGATPGEQALPVRLVFLGSRYGQPVAAGGDQVGAARATLGRWRRQVAQWAQSPSEAIARPYADAVRDAFTSDLDTPAALAALAALADDEDVPAGAKFETFASADMLLGLDLARDIGR